MAVSVFGRRAGAVCMARVVFGVMSAALISTLVFLTCGDGGKGTNPAGGNGRSNMAKLVDSRDGKIYKSVTIGKQIWMGENLNYAAEGSMCYNNNPDSCAKYGRFYTWDVAVEVCPAGWHLPDSSDWQTLVDYAGGMDLAGGKLRSTSGWSTDNSGFQGTDDFGFTGLPTGWYIDTALCRTLFPCSHASSTFDGFAQFGKVGGWWSANGLENDTSKAVSWGFYQNGKYVMISESNKGYQRSVRCLQD